MKTETKTEQLLTVRRDAIRRDPAQPRKDFTPASLAEMADSIKAVGIIEPLIVRRLPKLTLLEPDLHNKLWLVKNGKDVVQDFGDGKNSEKLAREYLKENNTHEFELIAGERRWRGAELAKLDDVPVIVRDYDAQQKFTVQMVENLQRENLTALDEGAAYAAEVARRRLIDPKFKVETLAKELGKSPQTVYGRMALNKLSPVTRQALTDGKIDVSVAAIIATIPDPKEQEKLIKRISDEHDWHYPYSFRDVQQLIDKDFQKSLKGAPFDQKAVYKGKIEGRATTLANAQACDACPKRSGNMTAEFPHLTNPNVCCDPACWRAKADAQWQLTAAKQAELGIKTLSAEEYEQQRRKFVKAKDTCYSGPGGKSWNAAVGKEKPAVILAQTEDGVIELFREDEARAAAKQAGFKFYSSNGGGGDAEQKKREAKKKQMMLTLNVAVERLLPKLVTESKDDPRFGVLQASLWPMLAKAAFSHTSIDVHSFIAKRRGLARTQNEARDALDAWLKADPTPLECLRMIVELLLGAALPSSYDPKWTKEFTGLCELAKVDLKAIEKNPSEARTVNKMVEVLLPLDQAGTLKPQKSAKDTKSSTADHADGTDKKAGPSAKSAKSAVKKKILQKILSPAARARIAAQAKARWAKIKAKAGAK